MVGGEEGDGQLRGSGRGAIAGCHGSVLWLGGGNDQLRGNGRRAIAGCQSLFHIFLHTNFTQTPKKTTMNFVLSFLQMLHCSLYWYHKNWFLLSGVYAGIMICVRSYMCRINYMRFTDIMYISSYLYYPPKPPSAPPSRTRWLLVPIPPWVVLWCQESVGETQDEQKWKVPGLLLVPTIPWLGGGFKYLFMFIPSWGRFPFSLIFFRWVETTNQMNIFSDFVLFDWFGVFLGGFRNEIFQKSLKILEQLRNLFDLGKLTTGEFGGVCFLVLFRDEKFLAEGKIKRRKNLEVCWLCLFMVFIWSPWPFHSK